MSSGTSGGAARAGDDRTWWRGRGEFSRSELESFDDEQLFEMVKDIKGLLQWRQAGRVMAMEPGEDRLVGKGMQPGIHAEWLDDGEQVVFCAVLAVGFGYL